MKDKVVVSQRDCRGVKEKEEQDVLRQNEAWIVVIQGKQKQGAELVKLRES